MSISVIPHGLYSLSASSVHGIPQSRVLEWVAISNLGLLRFRQILCQLSS